MKRISGLLLTLVLGAAPVHAQPGDAKGAGARFDATLIAGHAKVFGLSGPVSVTRATTARCTTHLVSAKDSWDIDWTSASINEGETTAKTLMVSMGPTQDFAIDFGVPAQLRAARAAGAQLAAACAG